MTNAETGTPDDDPAGEIMCPLGDGRATGDVVTDAYGFTWHRGCYEEEASIGTFDSQEATDA